MEFSKKKNQGFDLRLSVMYDSHSHFVKKNCKSYFVIRTQLFKTL